MAKKLIYLIPFMLVLALVSSASADLGAHWKFNNDATDSVGALNWTLNGGASYSTDAQEGSHSLQLDGVDDYAGQTSTLILNDAFSTETVVMWFKANSTSGTQVLYDEGGTTRGLSIRINNSNLEAAIRDDSTQVTASTSFSSTDWSHVAVTFDNGLFKLYLHGTEHDSITAGFTTATAHSNAAGIGARNSQDSFGGTATGDYFGGLIDDVQVYDNALSASEIAALAGGYPQAYNPIPGDGAMYEDTWASLAWTSGTFSVSHDVYIGENFDDVNDGVEGTFLGNQAVTSLIVGFPGYAYPDGLVPGTTYYWRIDEVNDTEPNSPWKGNVWSFTVPPRTAYNPEPADGVKFVKPDVELNWTGGFGAKLHYVHFVDNFDDVNNAVVGLPQAETTFTPGTLELDKVYYWRIDEFDGVATNKGEVWSFRTLPEIAITDENLVGWWTLDEGMGTNAVDWSGYGRHGTFVGAPQWADGYHGAALEFSATGQYVDCGLDAGQEVTGDFTIAAWVKLAPNNAGHYGGIAGKLTRRGGTDYMGFAIVRYNSNVFRLWVSDGDPDAITGQASSDLTYTDTGWHHVAGVREGQINTLYVDGVKQSETSVTDFVPSEEFFHIGRQYSHLDDRYFRGLIDDVRVYNQALNQEGIRLVMRGDPLLAWGPSPSNGSTPYIRDATPLSWSPGDNASGQDVYFGTDKGAVADANASDTTGIYRGRQGVTIYTPPEVEWGGGPYYWRIDEYNTDATISKGNVWSFTVIDFIEIDGIEDYNDYEPDRIFDTWIDGWGIATNGSEVGYADPNFPEGEHHVETTIVHGGVQSMPLFYDNNFKYSEATMTLVWPRDWTEEGVGVLSLWFCSDASNAAEPMYVALNGSAVVYHDDPSAAQIDTWTEWTIDLQEFAAQGVNLANVNTISIGFGDKNNLQAGGSGLVFFDDIRLYRPPEPEPAP